MAPYKSTILLSLLLTGASQAYWVPFPLKTVPGPGPGIRVVDNSPRDTHGDIISVGLQAPPGPGGSTPPGLIQLRPSPVTRRDLEIAEPQSTHITMFNREFDFPQLVPGSEFNHSALSNNSIGCAFGASNCANVGKADICCPDLLIISPIQVSLESSCFETERSPVGVICCQNPFMCERVAHHPEEFSTYDLTCISGYHECPAQLGGGCCPDGLSCGSDSCFEAISGPDGLNAYPEHEHEDDQDVYTEGDPKIISPYPTNVPRSPYKVLKTGVSILKTGEIEECVGPQCEDPLSGGTPDEVGQAIQSVVAGSGVVLTLTRGATAVGGIATHLPSIPGAPNSAGGIIGAPNVVDGLVPGLDKTPVDALKSDGSSYIKHGSSVWPRMLSGEHIRYLALSLVIHGVIGMRLNPGLVLINRMVHF
ncbi:hypothetical protein TWF481_004783 [Arthrobotrys musiformis]|uniref:Hydrophobin n=1 Tax=Arthrobotrys musiformis TaxID=47236 RepID=A0AAV9WMG2_9PEZI